MHRINSSLVGSTLPRALILLCLVWTLAPAPLLSQRSAGEVRLEVKDPSGAGVEAGGTLENLATGADQTFHTDAQGRHTFRNLALGRYRLQVSRAGFATQYVSLNLQSDAPVLSTVVLALSAPAFQVDVVGTTPLPGVDHSLDEIPAPVQTATDIDIEQSGALDLSDFLNRRMNGVYLNEIQGNPIQPDVNYRGYTASPLLGTPQGISVYMDGVRLNQPFGDVVSWDLIPRIAISETTLIPGSSPLFGLNTLGAAISIQTKDGRSDAGHGAGIKRRQLRTRERGIRARRLELERTELVPGKQPAVRRRLA